jgi:hypothetical protein
MSRWARAALLAVVVIGAVVVLFTVVFPWVDSLIADPVMGRPPPR